MPGINTWDYCSYFVRRQKPDVAFFTSAKSEVRKKTLYPQRKAFGAKGNSEANGPTSDKMAWVSPPIATFLGEHHHYFRIYANGLPSFFMN